MKSSKVSICDTYDFEDAGEEEIWEAPEPGERWPPLGAASVEDAANDSQLMMQFGTERLRDLEDQQENLNSSLMALTSHFAQVQLRLKQIVDAPAEDKQQLLQQLEDFAFRGIPEIPCVTAIAPSPVQKGSANDVHERNDMELAINKQKEKQRQLIGDLKNQLEELEHYAYEMGEADLPQSVRVHKQQIIIDELKGKLNLNVEDMDRLTIDDIRYQVDSAIDQLVNPLKMKEQLVIQLKTQILDLERFIYFLQGDAEDSEEVMKFRSDKCSCNCPLHARAELSSPLKHCAANGGSSEPTYPFPPHSNHGKEEAIKKTLSMIRRAATLLQLFTISQFGCGSGVTSRPSPSSQASRPLGRINTLKKTMRVNHWGDLRARLELAVVNVLTLAQERERELSYDDYSSDNDTSGSTWTAKVARAVRKQLAVSIRDLMHHGLSAVDTSTSLVPLFGCFPPRDQDGPSMHAWELILQYYHLKNGPSYNAQPVRKLSESFNLNMVGSVGVGHKHVLLSTIGHILTLHTKFKRSYDAQFKAFICAALNSKKLVVWLRLVMRCEQLVDVYYEPWSYVAHTKFEDSLQSLDKLSRFSFFLPVDTAVHHFQNIRDAF